MYLVASTVQFDIVIIFLDTNLWRLDLETQKKHSRLLEPEFQWAHTWQQQVSLPRLHTWQSSWHLDRHRREDSIKLNGSKLGQNPLLQLHPDMASFPEIGEIGNLNHSQQIRQEKPSQVHHAYHPWIQVPSRNKANRGHYMTPSQTIHHHRRKWLHLTFAACLIPPKSASPLKRRSWRWLNQLSSPSPRFPGHGQGSVQSFEEITLPPIASQKPSVLPPKKKNTKVSIAKALGAKSLNFLHFCMSP